MSSDDLSVECSEPADDEIDVTIRPAREVAARAIVLATVLRRLGLELGENPPDEARADAFDLREWLQDNGLLDAATAHERELLARPISSLSDNEIAAWSWQGAALEAIFWSLRLSPATPHRSPSSLLDILDTIPAPWDEPGNWIRATSIQPEETISSERERAEVWHWRAITEALRREAAPGDLAAIDAVIRDVVGEATASGVVADVSGGDFLVGGIQVRDLAPDLLDELQMTTADRLRALNWLCGFGESWDDVPLDV
jgi:hypothetical protein